jgi:hypothetical protein
MRMFMRSTSIFLFAFVALAGAASAADLPQWVNRGSAAFNNGGERAFYGVGSASGIKNPALLRSTADNRARAEVAKVFETFSASLMKDYMNSSGEQNVEQAVKTFSAMSLEGVEVRDRYIDRDGNMYSLAVLDIDKVLPAIQKAKESGLVRSDVKPVTVDDIFDKNGKKSDPPKPVIASAGDAGGEKAPKASTSDTKQQKGGGRPGWIDGEDKRFPVKTLLCAVGYGPKRDIAESGSYAAMSKVFIVHVQSASEDFMGAYSKTGAPSLEVQSSATLTKTSTEKLLTAVTIPEVWQDPKDTTNYALACIDRAKNTRMLTDQIGDLDRKVEASMQKAQGADAQTKLKELSRALDALLSREALNNELRIIDFDGVGVPSPYSPNDVSSALESAQDELRVGISAEGPYADDFRNALSDAMTKAGYKIEEGVDGVDVLIAAKIRMEDGGKGTGSASNLSFARGVVLLDIKNLQANRTIGSFNESRKEGHRSKDEAERRVVRELGKKLATQVGKKIDDTMKGKR